MYCGNNQRHPDLISGEKRLGTRYECFKKGVGVGLNLPVDTSYIARYVPIDRTKIYCGNRRRRPDGYDKLGNLGECLRKGVGVGKKIVSSRR